MTRTTKFRRSNRSNTRGMAALDAAVILMATGLFVNADGPKQAMTVVAAVSESDTNAIQRCIDSKASEVTIPFIDRPWVVEPLTLQGNQTIRLDPGVVLEAKAGSFRGKQDALLAGHEVAHVRILGYGEIGRAHV